MDVAQIPKSLPRWTSKLRMTSSSPAAVSELLRAPESVEAVGSSARAQEEPLLRLLWERIDPEAPAAIFRVPGRIELFGKHTDYAGGRSITCASDRSLVFLAQPSKASGVRIIDRVRGEEVVIDPEQGESSGPEWKLYPEVGLRRLAADFGGFQGGALISFASDLPSESGMSSSSALLIGTCLCALTAVQLRESKAFLRTFQDLPRLAEYLACVEAGRAFEGLDSAEGVGTRGGSEDHVAILCSEAERFSTYSYLPANRESTCRLASERVVAVAFSGIHAHKAGSAKEEYNLASRLASELHDLCESAAGRKFRHLAEALAVWGYSNALRSIPPDRIDLKRRLEHFQIESNEWVPEASRALAQEDFELLGNLARESQRAAETLLRNQTPETSFLTWRAYEAGADAACSFGAGFGGSVWAIVRAGRAPDFLGKWRRTYEDQFPAAASQSAFWSFRPGRACERLA